MKTSNKIISVGTYVSHTDPAGMQKATGLVVAEAGTRYGRRYLWVNYTVKKTGKTFNSAFWDAALIPSKLKTIVKPAPMPKNINGLWA